GSTVSTADQRSRPTPRRRRSRLVPAVILLVLTAVFAAVGVTLLYNRAAAGRGMPDYSGYSSAPDGLAQTADVLRKLGWQPVAVTRPIQQTRHRGLLILAEPQKPGLPVGPVQPLSDADVDGLLDWVHHGNTLLFCHAEQTKLLDRLGVRLTNPDAAASDDVLHATPGAVGEYTARVEGIGLERPATVAGRGAVPLWWLGSQPAAVLVRHGKGRVLVVPDASIL